MRVLSIGLASSVVLSFFASMAAAADLAPPMPAPIYDDNPMSGIYVRGDVGVGISKSYDSHWAYSANKWGSDEAIAWGGGVGYRYDQNWRGDVTFDAATKYKYKPCACTHGDIKMYSVTANGYYDMPVDFFARPYIGAGIGYGWVKHRMNDEKRNSNGLALAAMAGVTADLTNEIALDVGYKFRNISVSGEDYRDHLIRGGLRYTFN